MKTGHMPQEEQVLTYTIAQVARMTGLSDRTWWTLVRSGQIPTVKIGGRILVEASAVRELIKKRTDRTGSPTKEPPPHVRKAQERARLAGKK
jgi:excisionase family DNA binding protein